MKTLEEILLQLTNSLPAPVPTGQLFSDEYKKFDLMLREFFKR